MTNVLRFLAISGMFVLAVCAADEVTSAVHGAATKTEAATKTAVAKAKDAAEQPIHWTESTAVKGVDRTANGARDAYTGAKEGTEVVVHSTVYGTEKTDAEVKKLSKEGMSSVEGTVSKVGQGNKTVVVKTADGTEHTFEVVEHSSGATAAGIGKRAGMTGKVTVHYVEEGGKKVAHFFEQL